MLFIKQCYEYKEYSFLTIMIFNKKPLLYENEVFHTLESSGPGLLWALLGIWQLSKCF